MHARYYSFHTARFLSVDPVKGEVGSSQSWNRYGYVRGDPLRLIDPEGRSPFEPGDVVYREADGGQTDVTTVVSDSTPENDLDDESTIVVVYGGEEAKRAKEVTLNSKEDPYREYQKKGKIEPGESMTTEEVRERLQQWRTDEGDPEHMSREGGFRQCSDLAAYLTDRGGVSKLWNVDVEELLRLRAVGAKSLFPDSGTGWWKKRMVGLNEPSSGGQ